MAYITHYTYLHLINSIDFKKEKFYVDLDYFKKHIINNDQLYFFFNQFDLKKLIKEKMMLNDKDDKKILHYRKVPSKIDRYEYIFKVEGKSKYHLDKHCLSLNKGFKNFNIPEPISNLKESDPKRHKQLVDSIRSWFLEKKYTIEKYEFGEINNEKLSISFNNDFAKKHGVDNILISSGKDENQFQWYNSKDLSYIMEIKEFNYDDFLQDIDELIRRRYLLCKGITLSRLSKYDYLVVTDKTNKQIEEFILEKINNKKLKDVHPDFFKNYDIEKLKKFWKEYSELKFEAYKLLLGYIKWTYGYNDKNFDKIILENFNLECCHFCKLVF